MPLDSSLSIVLVLVGAVAGSLWLCDRYPWAQRVSSLVWILAGTALASNFGLIPARSSIYGQVSGFCVPFAVCLVLFGVRLRALRSLGRNILLSFMVAAVASLLGVVSASLALSSWLEAGIGADHWKLAGPYAGTYVGGSLNFFALWQGLQIDNPDLFAAANAVDNLTILPLMLVWTSAPRWLGGFFGARARLEPSEHEGSRAIAEQKGKVVAWVSTDVAVLSASAIAVIVVSEWVTSTWIKPVFPDVPSILMVTTLALLLGQSSFVRERQGGWELGYLAFYLFFAAVGATIDVIAAIELSPILFAYVGIVFVVHMLILFLGGKVLGLDLPSLVVASTATKGGPTLVPSVVQAHGWEALLLPGVLLGLLGYALGNYLGFATAYAVRGLL